MPKAKSRKSSARSTVSGPSRKPGRGPAPADSADKAVSKFKATDALAAAMRFNKSKEAEHGRAAKEPPAGQTAKPRDPAATGSTLSESNASEKVGTEALPGLNPGNGDL